VEIIQLLLDETNCYYKQYIDTLDEGPTPLRDVTVQEIYLFVAVVFQMGHDQRDTLKDYWSIAENFLWLLMAIQ
jgi:hypothetical protein